MLSSRYMGSRKAVRHAKKTPAHGPPGAFKIPKFGNAERK
jgi:hypothetical protein